MKKITLIALLFLFAFISQAQLVSTGPPDSSSTYANGSITCNAPISVNNNLGVCGAEVSYKVAHSATSCKDCEDEDEDEGVTQTAGLPSGSVFPVGVTTNTFVLTVDDDNTVTCSFTVTVTDNEKPVISVQNVARCFADDNFGCSINLGVTATDNCAVQSLTNNAPSCFPVGTTTVTWTATDIHGNVRTATQLVTRNPEINIDICAGPTRTIYTGTTSGVGPIGPQSVNLSSTVIGGTPGYSYNWTPSTGLNNALIANPVASPTVTTVYTLTVTDSKGCTRSLSTTINVLPLSAAVCSGSGNDLKFNVCHIPPGNASNPQNICISVNALNAHLTSGTNGHNNCHLGTCEQNCFSTACLVIVYATVANTVCGLNNGSITVSAIGGVAPYAYQINSGVAQSSNLFSNLGVGVYNITVTDFAGCTKTEIFNVAAQPDVTPPTITCNAPIVTSNDAGQCGAIVTYTVTSTDNCSGQTVAQTAGLSSGSVFPKGTTTNTFIVTDASGNTATCSFTVTVNDTENPTITCNAPISVNNDLGVCGAVVSYSITSSDNCPNKVLTQTAGLASGSVFPVGVTTNTFVVTDASGNTATCSFTVTVTDNEKPVISVQNIARCFADDNFGCSMNLGVTATDNCAVQSLTSNAPSCFPVGTTTVTWTATDIHGNVRTATQLVTRNPEININICAGPTRTIYTGTTSGVGPFGPQTVNLSSTVTGGTPGYSYRWTPSTGLNNALIANPVASPAVTTVYTLTVTDSKGCTRSLSTTINVLPLTAAVCSGSGNNVKFLVCHIPPGNASNPQNICISVNALNAHLTSGSNGHNNCYLGPCQQKCFSTTPGASSLKATRQEADEMIVSEEPIVEVQQPDFSVNVFPNPTAYDFSIRVMSKSNEPITIRIMDINGKLRSVETVFSKANNIKVGSNLVSGSYIAEVIQGSNRQMIKLVKLN